jgi:hypothetical protein
MKPTTVADSSRYSSYNTTKPTKPPESHRADPAEPLFLTLPPEIRNMVYELLFKRDEPVRLHDTDEFFAEEPNPEDYRNGSECGCWYCPDEVRAKSCRYYHDLESWEKTAEDDKENALAAEEDFRYDFSDGLGLLSCYRQIHHEASGYLYGHNTFAFTRTTPRYDCNYTSVPVNNEEWEEDSYEHVMYFQSHYAAHWLASIGNHYWFLTKVTIDKGAMCHCGWDHAPENRQHLPFVRLMWKYPGAWCRIVFDRSEEILENAAAATDKVHSPVLDEEVKEVADINLILDALRNQDGLDLKQFSSFLRALIIYEDEDRYHVSYKHGWEHGYSNSR